MNPTTLAKTLGWISIGLGATELIAPGWLQKKLGAGNYSRLVNVFGVREIGLMADSWSRNASDTIDLVGLATAVQKRMHEGGAGTALLALTALTALDALAAADLGEIKKKLERKPARERRSAGAGKPAKTGSRRTVTH